MLAISICNIALSQVESFKLNSFYSLYTATKDSIIVKYFSDKNNNLLMTLEDSTRFLLGAVGLGNSNIFLSDTCVRAVRLNHTKINSYVIETYVRGSTYGAKNIITIWYSKGTWNITRVGNYSRIFIEDRDKDGVFEFVEYYLSKKKSGDVYKFENGCLVPFNYGKNQ